MNVICYSRVATPDQAQPGQSLDLQKSDLRAYCQLKNYNIIGEYSEVASGSSFNRPQWNNLIQFCSKNKGMVDLILFTTWDRFSRNMYEAQVQVRHLNKMGIELNSVQQPLYNQDKIRYVLMVMYLTLPVIEKSKISKRTKCAIRHAKLQGIWTGKAPSGYSNIRTIDGISTLKPNKEAAIITNAFKKMASGKNTATEIVEWMKSVGFSTNKSQFKRMIQNVTYSGKVVVRESGKHQETIVVGKHPAIVSDEIFKIANENLIGIKSLSKIQKPAA